MLDSNISRGGDGGWGGGGARALTVPGCGCQKCSSKNERCPQLSSGKIGSFFSHVPILTIKLLS